jgi:lysophosphatidic acid acyltransferase / lysophosphatidylinositol acyltransferase
MGWAWKFGESVFLERNWEKDKKIISEQLKELVEYPNPIWVRRTNTRAHGAYDLY